MTMSQIKREAERRVVKSAGFDSRRQRTSLIVSRSDFKPLHVTPNGTLFYECSKLAPDHDLVQVTIQVVPSCGDVPEDSIYVNSRETHLGVEHFYAVMVEFDSAPRGTS